ncbi:MULTISPECIES: fatty acid desaturase [Idiomarina]|jgi:stearoyl-CoA desaturase (Delta-9 desaturase)|uniref:Fatty acid desaturase n=2 Tax=Idiomarina abyssalis TaxID=86102 RepID=A0A8I1GEG3_9GAMM|nr:MULTISPECIES: fatty acid desaturase [Idiomarina]KPD20691.1 acyl-CoA desaturase [Idiomarina abyssalis]MAB22704.1 acyl-CoA desaturase [Idiomarina sp.]MAO67839.1 acyl-CoA desaturase [Idiomarina sp.]MBF79579.1 acyl-CoA desaturase [Idiomarina sp.]MBJ7266929.1 fatty acid desaturase [Idiomarina abyssalis]|tara:strand:- start:662 stop:1801 length:1140 start_codon:yes stop_codon:yes gene_type:complete
MQQISEKPPIIWLNTLVFAITFIVALVGVPLYAYSVGIGAAFWWVMLGTACFAGLSITAGYHRLWAHRTYDANPVIRFIFAIGGAVALQNSALHWSSDHREHHKHVDDNDKDPYSAKRGFWYSHIGWMIREYQASRYTDYDNVQDLQKDPIVMWQHKYYLPLTLFVNFGWPIAAGFMLGDVWAGLLVIGVLRLVLNHHTTFFINSLAHIWGKQPYTDKNTARDNGVLAFLTFGEGYHNYHHIFAADYRNGIRWWHFDPTKWLIVASKWLGLAKNLKRSSPYQVERAKLQMQLKRAQQKAKAAPDSLFERAQEHYDQMGQHLKAYYQARKKLLDTKTKALKEHVNHDIDVLKKQVDEMKEALEVQKRSWKALLNQIQQHA